MNADSQLLGVKTFSKICRICLQTEALYLIDDVSWEGIELRKVLGNWISFETNYEQKMPQSICKSCAKCAYNHQYFISQIKRSEQILQNSLVNNLSTFLFLQQKQSRPISKVYMTDNGDNKALGLNNIQNKSTETPSLSNYHVLTQPLLFNITQQKKHESEKLLNEIKTEKIEIESIRDKVLEVQELHAQQKEWKSLEQQGKIRSQLHENFFVFCGVCESGFNTKADLFLHKKIADHRKGGIYVCPHCKLRKSSFCAMERHLEVHLNRRSFKCFTCGKAFNAKGDLQRHIKRTHLKQKRLKCKFCYRIFSKIEDLNEHETTHENIDYICSFCGKAFKKFDPWYNHERIHRQNELRNKQGYNSMGKCNALGEFQCSECGKVMCSKATLIEHMKGHKGMIFTCDICKKDFTTEARLKSHKNFVHTVGKYVCHICGHTVKQKYILMHHMKRVHEGDKTTIDCKICGKAFILKSSYQHHMRIHNNDTTYQCKVCFRICTTKRNLETHIRLHTGERSHECEHCGKKFAAKYNLKMHLKSHEGPPSYQCSICEKGFYANFQLAKHIRNSHGSNTSKTKLLETEMVDTKTDSDISEEYSEESLDESHEMQHFMFIEK